MKKSVSLILSLVMIFQLVSVSVSAQTKKSDIVATVGFDDMPTNYHPQYLQ